MNTITASEGQQLIDDVKPIILDVRTEPEFNTGCIPSATLIPIHELASRIDEISSYKDNHILVYCHSGTRSFLAYGVLTDNGFTKVHILDGGIVAWQREGYEVAA